MVVEPYEVQLGEILEIPLTKEQLSFYQVWLSNWKESNPIPIDAQHAYLFRYILTDVLPLDAESAIQEMQKLLTNYPSDSRYPLNWYLGRWVADLYVLIGEYDQAYAIHSGYKGSSFESEKISIGLATKDFTAVDYISFFGTPGSTSFINDKMYEYIMYLDDVLDAYQVAQGRRFIDYWASQSDVEQYEILVPTTFRKEIEFPLYGFKFANNKDQILALYKEMIREAENNLREHKGIPPIGQGWVSETELFQQVKKAFPQLKVVQHASPEWLGRQHLDVYLPQLKIAIEYQGKQHDEPVDFFGGIEAFENTQKRDARKRSLCKANDVQLIYVRKGYDIRNLIKAIKYIAKIDS